MRYWLTWRNSEGEVTTEIVTKVDPVAPVFAVGKPIGMSASLFERPGETLFEDDYGLFSIPTSSIIKLEEA